MLNACWAVWGRDRRQGLCRGTGWLPASGAELNKIKPNPTALWPSWAKRGCLEVSQLYSALLRRAKEELGQGQTPQHTELPSASCACQGLKWVRARPTGRRGHLCRNYRAHQSVSQQRPSPPLRPSLAMSLCPAQPPECSGSGPPPAWARLSASTEGKRKEPDRAQRKFSEWLNPTRSLSSLFHAV